jgi:hypothetical protein
MDGYLSQAAIRKGVRRMFVGILLLGLPFSTFAEEQTLITQGAQPIRDTLKAKVGAKVALQLIGGQEVSGKIVEVGEQAVHLAELTGKEFYDALIRLDHISALVLRVRDK